jgi:hypothetical protein
MDPLDKQLNLSSLKVSREALIETVAEDVLSQKKPVGVIDGEGNLVGVVHSRKVISVLFGSKDREK